MENQEDIGWEATISKEGKEVMWAQTDSDQRFAEVLRDFADSIDLEAEDLEKQKPTEALTEYGLRWDSDVPSLMGPVFIYGNVLSHSERASSDWARKGYPNTIVQRAVTAQQWQEIPES